MSALAEVITGTGVVTVIAGSVAAFAARRTAPGSPLPQAHAHNDYRHPRPLVSALANGFTSVEADIWPSPGGHDDLLVGHDRGDLRAWRTLRSLYLEPLAARVAQFGAVYPEYDGPFQLVIEIKSDPERTWKLLDEELREYADILTRYEDDRIVEGAINVVITGKPPRKQLKAAHAAGEIRYAASEESLTVIGSGTPVALAPVCSVNFGELFSWKGVGRMPDAQRQALRETVERVHADGRRIRFWGFPARSGRVRRKVWAELNAAGVDHLGADDLVGLRRFAVKAAGNDSGPRPLRETRTGSDRPAGSAELRAERRARTADRS
jgi:hypothetical protein